MIYKVPIGKIDLPDTREQLQNTEFNRTYLSKYIKDTSDKYIKTKEQELKLLTLELVDSDFVVRILAYNGYAKDNGYSYRSLYQYVDSKALLELPEEYQILKSSNSSYKSYYRSISTSIPCGVINNTGNKFISTTSRLGVSLADTANSFLIIIDDLKKLPVSQLLCLEQKFDNYYRINIDQNSHVDFEKYIKFFNTFILPFAEDCLVIKASELFTPELASKYKATRIPTVRTPSGDSTAVKSGKSLPCYRYLELTGKQRSSDFMYTTLTHFEHNGSNVFDASYASLFKGVIIPSMDGPESINISVLNSFSTLALSYNVPVTYLRYNKTTTSKDEFKDLCDLLSSMDDVFVYDIRNWEQGIEVLNFLQEGLVDVDVYRELSSLYYIQSICEYRASNLIVSYIVKGNTEQYPLANTMLEVFETEWHATNTNPDRIMPDPSMHMLINKLNGSLSTHHTVLSILVPSFTRTGYIHTTEDNLIILINAFINSNIGNFFHMRVNSRENTIGKFISDKLQNNEESS